MSSMSIFNNRYISLKQAIYVWQIEEESSTVALFRVKVINEKEKLFYMAFKNNLVLCSSEVPSKRGDSKLSQKQLWSYLKESAPRLDERWVFYKRVIFLNQDHTSCSIRLIQRNGLEWEIRRNGKIPTSYYFRFKPSHLHPDCASTTTTAITGIVNQLFQGIPNQRAQFEFFSTLEIVSTNDKANLPKPGEDFYLKPKTFESDFDKRIKVSKYMWAVTLIRSVGKSDEHAQIAIEGIRDAQDFTDGVKGKKETVYQEKSTDESGNATKITHNHFKLIAHFTGRKIKVKSVSHINYFGRSVTWKRPFQIVKTMVLDIKNEINTPPVYDRFGRYSIIKGKGTDSCITWAMDKLERGNITTFTKKSARIMAITSHYMKKNPICSNFDEL